MSEKILCVDDDPNILSAYRRALRTQFELVTALGAKEALALIESEGPFAVIVSDMRMPEISGLQFLVQVRQIAPHSVRMMLTGNNDTQTAIDAINEGSIFRFLNKPCSPEDFARTLTAGLEQYRLVMAEKDLLERTLKGSIKVLTEMMSLARPVAFGRASRVRRIALDLAGRLDVQPLWKLELAAMLSQIGTLMLSDDLLTRAYRHQPLTADEAHQFLGHPRVGSDLLKHIPRLEMVADLIALQEKHFDGSGDPADPRRGTDLPLGARILKVAVDYDSLFGAGLEPPSALQELRTREGWYDPAILDVLAEVLETESPYVPKNMGARELYPGLILGQDLKLAGGLLLLAKGQEITPSLCLCLKNLMARGRSVEEPVLVLVPVQPKARPALAFDVHPIREGIHAAHSAAR